MRPRRPLLVRTPGEFSPSPWTPTGVIGSCVWAFDGWRLAIVHVDKIDGTHIPSRARVA